MIRAQIFALNDWGKGKDEEPDAELWGEYSFDVLPKIGEDIWVMKDHTEFVLDVKNIQHFPVPNPIPPTDWPSIQRREPFTRVVGDVKWMR